MKIQKLDPFFWYLRWMHRRLLSKTLQPSEREFIADNIRKHRQVQWINLIGSLCVFFGLATVPRQDMGLILTALLAPVMVLGGAWFAVSFGAIPARFLDFAFEITFWMFAGFKLAATTMLVSGAYILSPWFWPVLFFIYVAIDCACTQYDTADGLKAGLDEALLKQARTSVKFYGRYGVRDDESDESLVSAPLPFPPE